MPVTGIQVVGGRELQSALRRAGVEIQDLKDVHLAAAKVVEASAEQIVPVLTGTLQGTIRSAGQRSRGVVRAGFKRTPYVGPIHFGWPGHNIAPNPFLYEAADKRADEVIDLYERRVKKVIRQI